MRRTTRVASLRSAATKSGRLTVSSSRILRAQKRSISTGRSAANTSPRAPVAIDLSSVKLPKARGRIPAGSICRPFVVVGSVIRAPPHGTTRSARGGTGTLSGSPIYRVRENELFSFELIAGGNGDPFRVLDLSREVEGVFLVCDHRGGGQGVRAWCRAEEHRRVGGTHCRWGGR